AWSSVVSWFVGLTSVVGSRYFFLLSFMGRLVARTDKMRNHGRCRTDVESAGDIFCLPVGHGHALMLAQVLRPGCHHEGFDISSRLGWIVEEAPSISAIAQAQRSHALHGRYELARTRRVE